MVSRTWVHQPYWIKQRQERWRNFFYEYHNHINGECDLDSSPSRGWYPGNCHLADSSRGRNIHCGCWMCSGSPFRRIQRRMERHQWRRQQKELLSDVDRNEFDVILPRHETYY